MRKGDENQTYDTPPSPSLLYYMSYLRVDSELILIWCAQKIFGYVWEFHVVALWMK